MALTADQVKAIKANRPTVRGSVDRLSYSLARQYGVSRSTIRKIWLGKAYTGTQGPRTLPDAARKTQWKKGQPSPNPKGKPEWSRILSKAYKKQLAKQYGSKDHTWADQIAIVVAKEAAKGNIKAAIELADRSEGRPTIYSQVMGPGGSPLYPSLPEGAPSLSFNFVSVRPQELHEGTTSSLPEQQNAKQPATIQVSGRVNGEAKGNQQQERSILEEQCEH